MPRKSNSDTYSRLSRRARAIPVDSQYAAPVAGIWTTVLSSQASRVTEVAACNTPQINIQPMHCLMLALEREGMRGQVDSAGKTVKIGRRGMALYIWIASQMQKRGYPDMDFSTVQRELNGAFLTEARKLID